MFKCTLEDKVLMIKKIKTLKADLSKSMLNNVQMYCAEECEIDDTWKM